MKLKNPLRIGSERTLVENKNDDFQEMANRTADAIKMNKNKQLNNQGQNGASSVLYSAMSKPPMIQVCSLKSQMDTQYQSQNLPIYQR